jgi:hypothetical protein
MTKHKLTDEQKEEDRRTRIQHPHMIKSKVHWESGYGDMEVPIVIPNSKSNHTTKIVVCTFVIIALIIWIIK